MRRNRIILLILWTASLFAISFYGGAVSYGLFVFFTAIPFTALLYILLVRFFFRIYQEADVRDLRANHSSHFYFTLQNESLMSFCGVRVLFYSSFSSITDLSDRTEYALLPHDGIRKHTGIVCRYRGEYEVGIKSIVITDFLRLFSLTCNNKEPFTVTVKPDIIHLDTLKGVEDPASCAENPLAEKSEADVISRQYVPGDDMRFINWKVSAAKGELMTRGVTGTGQNGVGIIMDPKRYGSRKEEYLPFENRMLEVLIALTLYYCKKNVPVTVFHTPGPHNKTVVDPAGFDPFYQGMCGYVFKSENDPALLFRQVLASGELFGLKHVFFIIRKMDEAAMETAAMLSGHGVAVTVYVVGDTGDGSLCQFYTESQGSQGDGSFGSFFQSTRDFGYSQAGTSQKNRPPGPSTPLAQKVTQRTVPCVKPLTEVM